MNFEDANSSLQKSRYSWTSTEQELYFLIAKFLSVGPCRRTYEALRSELDQHQLLPRRIDWTGKEHIRSYENLLDINRHIPPDHLLKICQRIIPLLNRELKPSVNGVISLLGAGRQSLLRTEKDVKHIRWSPTTHVTLHHNRPLLPPPNLAHPPNIVHILSARQQSGYGRHDHLASHSIYAKMTLLYRSLGHLSAVYCVAYDRTGCYIFTGADDHLVKVWSAVTGRLLCTMRGHTAEITDIACNASNTLLAAGSCDKLIRIWCLQTSKPVAVLHGHTHMITSVRFCPYVRGNSQYLVSTGGDGCLCVWEFDTTTKVFNTKPMKFTERSRAGTQMLCSSFSPGGIFLATGSSDSVVRVFCFSGAVPDKICELEAHTDRIDSIQYANHDSRFLSGSKDGTARIWRFERQEWKAIVLDASLTLNHNGTEVQGSDENRLSRYRVTMVCWSTDDQYVLTAVNDFTIKVWNSRTGSLVHILKGHQDELFVLEQHPVDSRIVLSAGHDGRIIIWDIIAGSVVKMFHNSIVGQGHGAVFDCKWSPDGQSFASTDSHGFVMRYGFGSSDRTKLPEEMFFHTDYRPLIRDANNYVLDEQTQQPPHLMAPPFLVDIDGNPHPARFQRLVPGRENCQDGQLVPMVVVNPNGEREVLDFAADHADAREQQQPAERPASDDTEDRPILDEMIARLQQDHDERAGVADNSRRRSPSNNSAARSALRRNRVSRAVDDVPQISVSEERPIVGGVQPAVAAPSNLSVWTRRVLVHDVDLFLAETAEKWRHEMATQELTCFHEERKKKPLIDIEFDSDSSSYMRTRKREKRIRRNHRSAANEETSTNRLLTRALYDSETEESSAMEIGAASQHRVPREREGVAGERRGARDRQGRSERRARREHQGTNEQQEEAVVSITEINQEHVGELSAEGESTEYSDWVPEGEKDEPPKRRSRRQVKRRTFSSPERSSSSDEDTEEAEDEDKTEEDEPRDEKESKREKLTTVARKKKPVPIQKNIKEKKRKIQRQRLDSSTIRELAPECRPPEWLTDVMPRKTPYVPQIGDEVIYFLQGHQQYVAAVKEKKIYDIDPEKNQPWHKMPHIREQELMRVTMIKYEIRAPRFLRLVCVKLSCIDPDTGRSTGSSFTIKYHDMSGVVDFIILRQTYNIAMNRNWNFGDRFRCLIDDSWWLGTVTMLEPFQDEYPDSQFQCIGVQWDNGETEKLSPWDLEPLDNRRIPSKIGASIPVTEAELESLRYDPQSNEWPRAGRDAECDRIVSGLEQIMGLRIAESFSVPVDLNAFPIYAMIIAYPVDLSTVKSRLENRFYRRFAALQYDVQQIVINARSFNDSHAAIVEHAHVVTELCLQFIRDSDCTDPMPLYTQLTKDRNIFVGPTNGHGNDDSSSDTTLPNTSPIKRKMLVRTGQRRGNQKSANRSKDKDWRSASETLLRMITEHGDSEPFRVAVDTREFPDYLRVISTPMDLGTVQRKLESGCYKKVADFCRDMRLVFTNSRAYNTNKRSRIYAMTLRLSSLFEDRIKKILQHSSVSPSSAGKDRSRPVQSSSSISRRGVSNDRATSSFTTFKNAHCNVEILPSNARSSGRSNSDSMQPGTAGYGRNEQTFVRHGPARTVKRARRYGSDSEDDEPVKRSRVSLESAPVQRQVSVQQRSSNRRPPRGSRMTRWLSDTDDEVRPGRSNPYLDSPDEEINDSDEEFTLSRRQLPSKKPIPKKSPKKIKSEPKPNKANGHASTSERYSTRCATGVIQRKRYDRVLSEDDETVDEMSINRGSRRKAHHRSDSDDDDVRRGSGKAIASKRPVKGSRLALNRSETNVDSSGESSSSSNSSSSGSATEAATDSELTDAYSDDDRPPVSAASTKTNLRVRSAGGRVANGRYRGREESDYEYDQGRMYRTRNRGRQTVHYNEESDGEKVELTGLPFQQIVARYLKKDS